MAYFAWFLSDQLESARLVRQMRWLRLSCLLFASLVLYGCGGTLRSQPPPQKWTAGFWFWYGSAARTANAPAQIDVLFFQAGVLQKETNGSKSGDWAIPGTFPEELPPAQE